MEVARLIERAGLNAIVLHEQPNSGRSLIEKFEAHGGAVGFAVVVLMTSAASTKIIFDRVRGRT